ncbi:hypothetical protein [Flexithrix dorotheae]|uniref:hypothetical protein n=1 Tax=Flexithrix dorotheae TaxID=70993 RepID=UPI0004772773|nr:hypothetical protein [Flexithrix dorotheae]
MENQNHKYFLLNYVFILGLIILLLNDHFFKLEYSNWITGKLSDFVGLLILPMVISYLFPKKIGRNVFITALFFIFWKSIYSQSLIDFYNQFALIRITRVVDYTDLIALSILPFSYYYLLNIRKIDWLLINHLNVKPGLILIPTIVIFMATSPPYNYRYTFSDGELQCSSCFQTLKLSKSEILNILIENDLNISIDSLPRENTFGDFDDYWKDSTQNLVSNYPYYKIDTLIVEKDTITDFQFALVELSEDKTKVWLNGMNISQDITDNKVERKLRKYYKKLLKDYLKYILKSKPSE